MKVVVTRKWSGRAPQVMAVDDALTPDPNDRSDTLDRMAADISDLQNLVGRLLGYCVENTGMPLEAAQRIVGLHGCEMHIHEPGTYGVD
ncbi:hypothetical protein KABACHOK_01880 [Brevundimonas phage vB_BpoS-Kabachok]|uniref:Uncharacterized protein n=1 Tax=Brevundimonas phage vB_BpoS-Kabachok TaxID=2948600 RepID=A0A9E7MPK3_9CAUD|nr:hypothetical protein KABACHOK_01880 [Brevundimonas phage vB_BpoS-Kabachok]